MFSVSTERPGRLRSRRACTRRSPRGSLSHAARITSLIVVLLCACLASTARATIGGPELARPLGWNASSRTVYFEITPVGESGDASTIVALSVDDAAAGFRPLPWSVSTLENAAYRARLARLRRGLVELEELGCTSIPARVEVDRLKPLQTPDGAEFSRYRVTARDFGGFCVSGVQLTAYRDPSVRMLRVFRVPGTPVCVGIVSFIGLPFETGYERQVPICVSEESTQVVRIRDWTSGR